MSRLLDPHRWARLVVRTAVGALVVLIAGCVAWRVHGGHWERVETPSMGTVAPVGSLLWVEPTDFAALRPGDFITFRPPGSATTYSHRVLARQPDGTITTKGVIPGPDPWHLTAGDVVGKVRATWWGAGWLVAAAPVLLLGGLVIGAARSLLAVRLRLPATLVLGSALVALVVSLDHPLVGAEQLAFTPDAHGGGATATYVGTGLLPIRLTASTGEQVVMRAGEVGSVHVAGPASSGSASPSLGVALHPALPPWWWVPLVVACFLPAIGSSLRGAVRARRHPRHRGAPLPPGSAAPAR